jgi:hypothetical protein
LRSRSAPSTPAPRAPRSIVAYSSPITGRPLGHSPSTTSASPRANDVPVPVRRDRRLGAGDRLSARLSLKRPRRSSRVGAHGPHPVVWRVKGLGRPGRRPMKRRSETSPTAVPRASPFTRPRRLRAEGHVPAKSASTPGDTVAAPIALGRYTDTLPGELEPG